MLGRLFKSIFATSNEAALPRVPVVPPRVASRRLLNVGGGSKAIRIPDHYADWQHDMLDINPGRQPEVVMDARDLKRLPAETYDAVYCSHNLEHYYPFDAVEVLEGFLHVLVPSGFAEIRVPDILGLMRKCATDNLDMESVLYQSQRGPISVRDVLYGLESEIESSGNDFFAHKTGFSEASLKAILLRCGFVKVATLPTNMFVELRMVAFKNPPDEALLKTLGLQY